MASHQDNTKLIAPCGLYCGSCTILKARGNSALTEKLAQALNIPAEQVNCLGCREQKGHIPIMGEPMCPTYQCCIEQKSLEFCYQCQEFPCLKLAPAADKAQVLPHNSKVYNLVLLQKLGVEKWLQKAGGLLNQYLKGKKSRGGDELEI